GFYGSLFADIGTFASEGLEAETYQLKSIKTQEPVVPTMMQRMLKTLPLFLVTTLLVWTLAFPTGIYSALRRGRPSEVGVTIVSYAMISLPSFWLALLVINFFTGTLGIPVAAPQTLGTELDGIQGFMDKTWHVAVPSVIAALSGIALLSRYVKGQMLEVMHADFVRTAKAKGLNDDVVYYKHALRNAALPFITMIGGLLPSLFGGSIVFEAIYAWPGLGRWSFQAVMQRDYTIVMTTLFVSSTLTLIGILISDLLYGVVDPRIKLS
ncbi:MAG: ABC transporter permease, partial [Planctomycetes bacterium]|nr:ABC transporter permease [Planctomycetota bacterium]